MGGQRLNPATGASRARQGHPVKAAVEVEAGSGGERKFYDVVVRLSWR